MKSYTSKYLTRHKIQQLFDQQEEAMGNLKQIESQLEQSQKHYLQTTWKNGNILIGWFYSPRDPQNNDLLLSLPKDKIFSTSSITSNASKQLQKSGHQDLNFQIQNRLSLNLKKKKRKQHFMKIKSRKSQFSQPPKSTTEN